MLKRIFVTFLVLCSSWCAYSQLSVASFRALPNDLSARVNETKLLDSNGEVCAIIKVVTTQTGFSFDCGIVGIHKVLQKPAEIWVYIPKGTKRMTIAHPQLGLLRDYFFDMPIEASCVYELVLTSDIVKQVVEKRVEETQFLTITSKPDTADVYLNDQPMGKTPFYREMPLGKYTWSVRKEPYKSDAGVVELKGGSEAVSLDVTLKPNFGTLTVTSTPESEGDISIDKLPRDRKTPYTFYQIPSGKHTVTVSRPMHETTTLEVMIEPGDVKELNIDMKATYSMVTVATDPQADIYVNNVKKAFGSWTGRLDPGIHTLEAKLDKHTAAMLKQKVVLGVPVNVTLHPVPRTGVVKVVSNPFSASIKLDGVEVGKTPFYIKNQLIGDYTLLLTKDGYGPITKRVTVLENDTVEVNETLPNGMKVVISSTPANADLYIDGKAVGKTPYDGTLAFGQHAIRINNGSNFTELNEIADVSENQSYFNYTLSGLGKQITIDSNPSQATLSINHKPVGTTPVTAYMPFGDYSIQLDKKNYNTYSGTLPVRSGTSGNLTYDLTKTKAYKAKSSISNYSEFGYFVSYQTMEFLNDNYQSNVENGTITPLAQFHFGITASIYPVRFDMGATIGGFDVPDLGLNDDQSLTLTMLETSLSFYFLHLGKTFLMYAGAGYQLGGLTAGTSSEYVSKMNMSSPYAKIGAQLNLGKIFLMSEVNQTFLTANDAENRQIRFGIGLH
jgi:hypothetical protein